MPNHNPTLPQPILPPLQRLLRKSDVFNSWSVNYGAVDNALQYAGLTYAPHKTFYAFWAHGIFGPWETHLKGRLTYNTGKKYKKWHTFTARQDEQEILTAQGHKHAKAIGAPIVYAPIIQQPRIANSLLIVPTHTLPGIQFPDRIAFLQYVEQIKFEAKKFDHVFLCLHPSCLKNGLWVDEFTGSGVRLIVGASPSDINSLTRMRSLFSAVEYVTTNGWGSHLSYALAEGAKVSLFGTEPRLTVEQYRSMREVTWGRNTKGLRQVISQAQHEKRMEYFAKHICKPKEGSCDVKKGQALIGSENKLSPSEMAECLQNSFNATARQYLLNIVTKRQQEIRMAAAWYLKRVSFSGNRNTRQEPCKRQLVDFDVL